jgi:uncharacterized protein (TIGR02231 family)
MTGLRAVCLLGLVFFPAAGLPVQAIDSKISEVTVYLDRARITRVAETELSSGESIVEFSGLPAGLDESSVEVSGTASTKLLIQGIDLRQVFLAESANPAIRRLTDELRGLEDQKTGFEAQRRVLEARQKFLSDVGASLGSKDAPSLDLIRQVYALYGDEIGRLSQQSLDIDESIRKLEPEIERVRQELNRLKDSIQRTQRQVSVKVKADGAGSAKFAIRYTMPDCGWVPDYDARVESSSGKVQLASNAMVRQRTGEDWSDIRLVLSTSRPGESGRMPELDPDFVDFLPPPRPLPLAARQEAVEAAPVPQGTPEPAADTAMQYQAASAELSGLSYVYLVGLPVTIPSDGEPHRTALSVQSLSGRPEFLSTPKLEPAAFLRLKLKNESDGLLLPGQLNVFRDGDFIGTLHLEAAAPGAEFELFAGRDDSIKLERKELINKRSETGLIQKKAIRQKRYQITFENFRPAPVKLTVLDQLPVSRNKEIAVIQGPFSDKPVAIDPHDGKITWEIELQPRQKKLLEFEYTIEWPAGRDLTGEG